MGTEHDGASVDLVLTNTSDYVGDTGSTKVNGKYGKLGNINLQVDNKVNISFKFVNAQDQPVTLPCFYFSVFDIDRAGKKIGKESVIAYGIENKNVWVSENSDLIIINDTEVVNSLKIKADRFGDNCDNPVDPEHLVVENCYNAEAKENQSYDQRDFTIKFKYEKKSEFSMQFKASKPGDSGSPTQ